MKNRKAWGLVGVLAVLAETVWVRGATREAPPRSDRFYHNLEGTGNDGGLFQRNAKQPLQLVVTPTRRGKTGLLLRVEVWNCSSEAQRVYPIYANSYYPDFRDRHGTRLRGDLINPGYPRVYTQDELSWVQPGHCLATNYWFPTFYTRMAKAKGIECQVRISSSYGLDSKFARTELFELSSGWVKIPE